MKFQLRHENSLLYFKPAKKNKTTTKLYLVAVNHSAYNRSIYYTEVFIDSWLASIICTWELNKGFHPVISEVNDIYELTLEFEL